MQSALMVEDCAGATCVDGGNCYGAKCVMVR